MIKVIRVNGKIKLAWFILWLIPSVLLMYAISIIVLVCLIIRNLLLSIGDLSLEPLKDTEHDVQQIINVLTE